LHRIERLSQDNRVAELTRKPCAKAVIQYVRSGVLSHEFYGARGRDDAGIRKAIQQNWESEEVIPVSMGDVNRSEAAVV
jgi:hypothetical protein